MIGWAFVALTALSLLLVVAVWFALREPSYAGVMAATGLSYLGLLTVFGVVVLCAALLPLFFAFSWACQRPLSECVRIVREVARGNLETSARVFRSDEWGVLLDAFDTMTAALQDVLRERFGFDTLRPLQAQIVERLMDGGDALVVMPTGSGKSLCYQLPALAMPQPGIALVFSPLIALMEDQVAALRKKGVQAQYINSTLTRKERERRYARVAEGAYEIVYATPERMHKPEFVQALETVPGGVKLLAVDEAHCISKWGHDLRPAYREVGRFRRRLGHSVSKTKLDQRSIRRVPHHLIGSHVFHESPCQFDYGSTEPRRSQPSHDPRLVLEEGRR